MLYYQTGSEDGNLSSEDLKNGLFEALALLGKKKKVLVIPPDYSRFHSRAGELTGFSYEYFREALTGILPALGTHAAMTGREITNMFKNVPQNLFRTHRWRDDIVTLGAVPSEFVKKVSEGKVNYPWPVQVNKLLVNGNFDLILSVGQVVPHEVTGMANYNKNILIGTGGEEGINKSHFLGAVYGMERIMGRADTPVRQMLNYASDHFIHELPIVYVLTVIGRNEDGELQAKGLFIGDDRACFSMAADLSLKVNFKMLDKPLKKVVVYLDPDAYKSTWLGNKSVYRTRMAIDDGGELVILAPGLKSFGEDKIIDNVIRKYGYVSTPEILDLVDNRDDLRNNLSAAAHLIHGSAENRFKIIYCPGNLTQAEIEGVSYEYADLQQMLKKYDPGKLKEGYNRVDGEEIYFIPDPALGLWAYKNRF